MTTIVDYLRVYDVGDGEKILSIVFKDERFSQVMIPPAATRQDVINCLQMLSEVIRADVLTYENK